MSELRTNRIVPRDGIPSASSGTLNGGGILQIVTKNKLDAGTLTSSYSAGTSYDISGLSLTIKPSSSSNMIWIQGFIHHNVNSSQQASFYVKRNGTVVSPIGDAGGSNQGRVFASAQGNQDYYSTWVVKNTPFWFMDTPATTSTLTYQVGCIPGTTTAHIYINMSERDYSGTYYDYRTVSNITAWEVSA